jgi:hypothetical protein
MVDIKRFSQMKQKQDMQKRNYKLKKSGTGKPTPIEIIEDEHERVIKYVDMDFKKQGTDIPITNDEILYHVRKSLERDPFFNWVSKETSDGSYYNVIEDVRKDTRYTSALAGLRTDIVIKKTKRTRKGIPLNKNYFVVVRKGYVTKKGIKVSQTRIYYSTKNGKSVKKDKVEKYMKIRQSKELISSEKVSKLKKKQSKYEQYKQRKKTKSRLERIRRKR